MHPDGYAYSRLLEGDGASLAVVIGAALEAKMFSRFSSPTKPIPSPSSPPNNASLASSSSLTSPAPPKVTITNYANRLLQWCQCSPSCLAVAYSYISRLEKTINIDAFNTHRLLFVGVVVAAKLMDDRYYTQTHYSMCGGVERAELNIMEVEFLQLLGWKARVDVDELRHNLIEAMEWTLAATHNNDNNNYNHDAISPQKNNNNNNNNNTDNSRFLNTAFSGDAESLKCPDLSGDLSPMASGF
jgi:hypothetical protein